MMTIFTVYIAPTVSKSRTRPCCIFKYR